jgi:hypothetical protein
MNPHPTISGTAIKATVLCTQLVFGEHILTNNVNTLIAAANPEPKK